METKKFLDFITSESIEGGYQNSKKDKGNRFRGKYIGTNRGITPQAYYNYYGKEPTVQDMKNITKDDAHEIYIANYLKKPKIDKIEDNDIRNLALDYAINSGSTKAIRDLQRVLKVEADGHLGPKTLKKLNEGDLEDIKSRYADARKGLIKESGKINKGFKKGLLNRVDRVMDYNKKNKLSELEDMQKEIAPPTEEPKLQKLEKMKEGLSPLEQPQGMSLQEDLGFNNGGIQLDNIEKGEPDLLERLGIPQDENRDQYVTQDNIPNEELDKLDAEPVDSLSSIEPVELDEVSDLSVERAPAEIEAPSVDMDSLEMPELETEFKSLMEAPADERKTAAWATAASQIASLIDKYSAVPKGIKPINFQSGAEKPLSEYQKQMLGIQKSQVQLGKDKLAQAKELADKKLAAKADAPKKLGFKEKEEIKGQVKEDIQTGKEDRKLKRDMQDAIPSLQAQEDNVDKAINLIESASKEGGMSDTGPIDQYINKFTDEGQQIEQALNRISLDTMVKMFSGMSKAIDSDAERAFFQSSQPEAGKFPNVNLTILKDMKKNIQSLKDKTSSKLSELDGEGSQEETPEEKTVMKKEYSKSRDKTRITYSDGTTEILDGKQ